MSKAINDFGKGKILTYQKWCSLPFYFRSGWCFRQCGEYIDSKLQSQEWTNWQWRYRFDFSSFNCQKTFLLIQNPNLTSSQCAAVNALPIMLICVNRRHPCTSNHVESRPFRLISSWTLKQMILWHLYLPLWINYRTRDSVKASG